MIVRWTAGALADLISIETYQRLHWPASRAAFDRRLTAIEGRIAGCPLSAPEVAQRPGVRVAAFIDSPIGFSTALNPAQSMFWRSGTHRADRALNKDTVAP